MSCGELFKRVLLLPSENQLQSLFCQVNLFYFFFLSARLCFSKTGQSSITIFFPLLRTINFCLSRILSLRTIFAGITTDKLRLPTLVTFLMYFFIHSLCYATCCVASPSPLLRSMLRNKDCGNKKLPRMRKSVPRII